MAWLFTNPLWEDADLSREVQSWDEHVFIAPGHAKQPEGAVSMDDWIGGTYAPTLMVAEAEVMLLLGTGLAGMIAARRRRS